MLIPALMLLVQVHNQIDFTLTHQRFKSRHNKAKTSSLSADIGSDRDVVLTTIKLKLKTKHFTESSRIRFDLEKLKHRKTAGVFQAKVHGKFAVFYVLDSDADTLANSLKEGLLSIAEEVLGRQRKNIQP